MMKALLTALTFGASALLAGAAEDAVTLELTGNDQMQYNKKELSVKAGQEVTIEFEHVGQLPKEAMGHNVVVLKSGTELAPFAMSATQAKDDDYIPQDEESQSKIIAHTEMIGGGESTSVTFTAPEEPGDYPYVCTFPGHFSVMNGTLTVEAAE